MWASGHSADSVKRAAHGYAATREEAMAAFAKQAGRERLERKIGDGDKGGQTMWKVGAVEPVRVLGAEGYPYGFNSQARRPLASTRRRLRRAGGRRWRGAHSLSPGAPQDRPWMWGSGHSADSVSRAAYGYEATREAAMAAFAKS